MLIEEKLKQNKNNILINKKLLNKYSNVREIFEKELNNDRTYYFIFNKSKLLNRNDINKFSNTEIFHLAVEIFKTYHSNNVFINNKNKIIVSNTDIKENVNKINNNYLQKMFLYEHLIVFSYLGSIIEKAVLVNQTLENKNRKDNNIWSYYLENLKIGNKYFLFEFDVISKNNGENYYRVRA